MELGNAGQEEPTCRAAPAWLGGQARGRSTRNFRPSDAVRRDLCCTEIAINNRSEMLIHRPDGRIDQGAQQLRQRSPPAEGMKALGRPPNAAGWALAIESRRRRRELQVVRTSGTGGSQRTNRLARSSREPLPRLLPADEVDHGASCEKRVRPSFCLRPRGERGSADGTQRSQDDSDRHCGRGVGAAGVHGACLPVMRASTREEMRRISSTSRSSSRLFSIHSR